MLLIIEVDCPAPGYPAGVAICSERGKTRVPPHGWSVCYEGGARLCLDIRELWLTTMIKKDVTWRLIP